MNKPILIALAVVLTLLSLAGCVAPTPTSAPPPAATTTPAQLTPIPAPSPTQAPTPIPRALLPIRGLYVQFDHRGVDSGYWSGDVIRDFYKMDEALGRTVKEEVSDQLDQMAALGVNYLTFELRSANGDAEPGPFVPPDCYLGPSLGILYPNPSPEELTNLVAFLDLVHSKGMKVALRLVNIHMDEEYKAHNEQWLGPILKAIKGHPALDLVLFEGSNYLIDTDGDRIKESCGVPAEPPLFAGPGQPAPIYIAWAMQYAHDLGFPWRQLSAQAMEGHYFWWSQAPNPFMTDGHFWDPIEVLKMVFDELGIPDNERTYALSLYENRKCKNPYYQPCEEDLNPHAWTIETVEHLYDVIGRGNGARVVVVEMSLLTPVEPDWTTEMAVQSLVEIMQAYGIEGGSLWRWTVFMNYEELDPGMQIPVRKRGVEDVYTPVKDVLKDMYTRGVVPEFNLTPETIPPVFGDVSVSSETIRNGQPLVITANLGEPDLFVSADISELDPGRKSLVLFRQVRDGVYEQTITLDPWIQTPNGVKTVTLRAMDFWSNTSLAVLNVSLDNPLAILDADPPDDDFTGTALEPAKWTSEAYGGASVGQDEKLVIRTGDQEPYSAGGVLSTWAFDGDFDVEVAFEIADGWQAPKLEHVDGAYLGAVIAGQEYRITRLRDPVVDKLFAWDTAGNLNASKDTSAVSGKYRMVRSGTTLTFLFDIGNGWREMASTTVPDGAAQVRLGNGSIDARMDFTTYFDDFKINHGVTNYLP